MLTAARLKVKAMSINKIVPMLGKNSLLTSEAPETFECHDPQRSGHRTEACDPRDGNPGTGGSVEVNLGKSHPPKRVAIIITNPQHLSTLSANSPTTSMIKSSICIHLKNVSIIYIYIYLFFLIHLSYK